MPADKSAYQIILPGGTVRRHLCTRPVSHALIRRINDTWTVEWCVSPLRATEHAHRHSSFLLHRSGLQPHQYEVHVVPVTQIDMPKMCWVAAMLPGKHRVRKQFIPEWGEAQPIAVVAVADQNGWKAASWPTTEYQMKKERKRLQATHDQVTSAPAVIEKGRAHASA